MCRVPWPVAPLRMSSEIASGHTLRCMRVAAPTSCVEACTRGSRALHTSGCCMEAFSRLLCVGLVVVALQGSGELVCVFLSLQQRGPMSGLHELLNPTFGRPTGVPWQCRLWQGPCDLLARPLL